MCAPCNSAATKGLYRARVSRALVILTTWHDIYGNLHHAAPAFLLPPSLPPLTLLFITLSLPVGDFWREVEERLAYLEHESSSLNDPSKQTSDKRVALVSEP